MNIKFFALGKTADDYLKEAITVYQSRLKHYVGFSMEEVVVKSASSDNASVLLKEADKVLSMLKSSDYVVLLDAKGEQITSEEFAARMNRLQIQSVSTLVFIAGSAYGFHKKLYDRADYQLGLSKLTFTHQMVRLIFIEQLYRAFTIIRNEKYHH